MNSIFSSRGCIYAVNQGGGGKGFYALNPSIGGNGSSPVLIMGAALNDDDIVIPKPTLDRLRVLYSFGPGFGQAQIHGAVLLGDAQSGGAGMKAVASYFESNRTSAKRANVQLSIPGNVAYNIYLTGLAVGQTDPQFHIQQFMLGGIVMNPSS